MRGPSAARCRRPSPRRHRITAVISPSRAGSDRSGRLIAVLRAGGKIRSVGGDDELGVELRYGPLVSTSSAMLRNPGCEYKTMNVSLVAEVRRIEL
jgi:hypothetical protein